jgi:acetyl-CoA acetyltransferase
MTRAFIVDGVRTPIGRYAGARRAAATMCVGVGQGIAVLIERVP